MRTELEPDRPVVKWIGRVATAAGLLGAAALVGRDDPRAVLDLMRVAGAGIIVAALVHVLPMLANGRLWQMLIARHRRPGLGRMLQWVWIRESVNGLLPVARIGGEIASFRLMRRGGVRPAGAAASILVDMQITMIGQLLFTLFGVGFLLMHTTSGALQLAGDLAWGAAALTPLLVLFALIQHARPFERATRILNHVAGGKLAAAVGESTRIDRRTKLIWRRWPVILRCIFFWQPVQLVATALELWIAARFMHVSLNLVQAVALESLIQAVDSVAFFVPGALGVQEGGFLLIGGALGLDPAACLALAGARRVRDLVVYVPGLLAWQFSGRPAKSLNPPRGIPSLSAAARTRGETKAASSSAWR